ncbi:MAG: acetyl-CoA acetyltransferase [Anaerolineaceae bacterium 4572_32.1]|nr:MAG: acetyl-CoA acetyltransferase [Anaerolineaceae bacterium 4572_32.1]
MREVSIVGLGQTKVGEHWGKSLRHLAGDAVLAAMQHAGIDRADVLYVGNMLSGQIAGQEHLGALVADFVGLRGIEAVKIEAACASGAAAVRQALIAVSSGMAEIAIAVGVEKMTDEVGSSVTSGLATAADADYESAHGLSFVAINALLMRRYMYEFGYKREDFAPFAINAHANAVNNPYAMFPRPISAKAFARAGMIASPISLFDSSPICDGAAAVVIVPSKQASAFTEKPVRIAASATATDSVALHDRHDPLFLQAAHDSAYKAYLQAGVGPKDIDLFELHDAFTVMSALSLEASGFAERGQGVALARDGEIRLDGRVPITTMGGLKARGHPVGATGVYQIIEVAQQLRGEAGANQLPTAHWGMAQNIGGSGATIVTHILESS